MIPALIVPILNRPELLFQMLSSIDCPTDRVVVIDNGGVFEGQWRVSEHIRPGHNLGVAASWNLGIKATAQAPWWLIVNFDVTFAPGDLKAIAEAMETEEPTLLTLHGLGFAVFAVNTEALEVVGLFDENLHPAYFEDNDFAWRAHVAGVRSVELPSRTQHLGSATIFGDHLYRDQNHKTFQSNKDYYATKWGGLPGQEVNELPFGRPHEPSVLFGRVRDQRWRRVNDEVG